MINSPKALAFYCSRILACSRIQNQLEVWRCPWIRWPQWWLYCHSQRGGMVNEGGCFSFWLPKLTWLWGQVKMLQMPEICTKTLTGAQCCWLLDGTSSQIRQHRIAAWVKWLTWTRALIVCIIPNTQSDLQLMLPKYLKLGRHFSIRLHTVAFCITEEENIEEPKKRQIDYARGN